MQSTAKSKCSRAAGEGPIPQVEGQRDGAVRKILGRRRQQAMQIHNGSSFGDHFQVLREQLWRHRQVEWVVCHGLDASR
jgi:hypothetical protein